MAASSVGKLIHTLLIVVSAIIAAFVAAVLADGRSVIVLKPTAELSSATNDAALISMGLNWPATGFTLEALLGKYYGVGLHHDSFGRFWTEVSSLGTLPELLSSLGAQPTIDALPTAIGANALKHPVKFLECKELLSAGQNAMILAFIGAACSLVMILLHSLALGGMISQKMAKFAGILLWLVFTIFFLVVVVLGYQIYSQDWTCDQPVIPTIKLSDHFELSYGIPFAIIGLVASFVALVLMIIISPKESTATTISSTSKTSSSSSSS